MEGRTGGRSLVAEFLKPKPERRENQIPIEEVSSFEEFIDAVDFEALNGVLEHIARKSGRAFSRRVRREDIIDDTATLDRMSEDKKIDVHGGADPIQFKVHFSWSRHTESVKAWGDKVPAGVQALHALIHEITHLYAKRSLKALEVGDKDLRTSGPAVQSITGYQEQQFGTEAFEISQVAVSLNEAVTEELGLEVFNEYVRRVGERSMISAYPEAGKIMNTISYASDRLLLQAVISSLAKRLGVDRDLVWGGFVRGYINGEEKTTELVVDIMRQLMDHEMSALLSTQMLEGHALSDSPDKVLGGFEYEHVRVAADKILGSIQINSIEDALGLR